VDHEVGREVAQHAPQVGALGERVPASDADVQALDLALPAGRVVAQEALEEHAHALLGPDAVALDEGVSEKDDAQRPGGLGELEGALAQAERVRLRQDSPGDLVLQVGLYDPSHLGIVVRVRRARRRLGETPDDLRLQVGIGERPGC
jgi:hypothetical protein